MAEDAEDVVDAAEDASDSKALDVVARLGFAFTAVVHLVIGITAISIAFGGAGEADPGGAVERLASQPLGPWIMWAGAASCAGLALWQLSEATVRARHLSARQRLGKALSSGSLCVAYGSLAGTFATIGFGRDQDSRRSTRDFSATLLQTPVGVPVLVALGATVIGVGIYFIVKGITGKFRRELRRFKNNVLIDALGVVGHIAKGVALTLVGILFIVAALKRNPDESTGLDGGLKALALQPYGPLLLVVIGGGLIFYGLFAIVRAKFGRISA